MLRNKLFASLHEWPLSLIRTEFRTRHHIKWWDVIEHTWLCLSRRWSSDNEEQNTEQNGRYPCTNRNEFLTLKYATKGSCTTNGSEANRSFMLFTFEDTNNSQVRYTYILLSVQKCHWAPIRWIYKCNFRYKKLNTNTSYNDYADGKHGHSATCVKRSVKCHRCRPGPIIDLIIECIIR